jgi:hypothetical protein
MSHQAAIAAGRNPDDVDTELGEDARQKEQDAKVRITCI